MECVSKYLASENTCKECDAGLLQCVTEVTEGCRGLYETLDIFRKRIGKIPLPAKYWKNAALPGAFTWHRGIQSLKNRTIQLHRISKLMTKKACTAGRLQFPTQGFQSVTHSHTVCRTQTGPHSPAVSPGKVHSHPTLPPVCQQSLGPVGRLSFLQTDWFTISFSGFNDSTNFLGFSSPNT